MPTLVMMIIKETTVQMKLILLMSLRTSFSPATFRGKDNACRQAANFPKPFNTAEMWPIPQHLGDWSRVTGKPEITADD
jgi:hypothetical protein